MARYKLIGILLMSVCLQACSIFQEGASDMAVELNETFQLRIGETAVFEQINPSTGKETEITFREFNEDSRCPINLVCIWEGQVEVTFSAITDSEGETLDFVGFVGTEGDTFIGQSFGQFYELQLSRLDPYPTYREDSEPVEVRPEDVVATLRIVESAIID